MTRITDRIKAALSTNGEVYRSSQFFEWDDNHTSPTRHHFAVKVGSEFWVVQEMMHMISHFYGEDIAENECSYSYIAIARYEEECLAIRDIDQRSMKYHRQELRRLILVA